MKSKNLFFIATIIFFTSICIAGCKSNAGVKPAPNQEILTLSNYYSDGAKVNTSKINYNPSNDTFSINGHAVISHSELLSHYKSSLTGRIQ